MVGSAATTVFAVEVSHDRVLDCAAYSIAPHRAFCAFRSRAPPALL
jgi:hypothetical protein